MHSGAGTVYSVPVTSEVRTVSVHVFSTSVRECRSYSSLGDSQRTRLDARP